MIYNQSINQTFYITCTIQQSQMGIFPFCLIPFRLIPFHLKLFFLVGLGMECFDCTRCMCGIDMFRANQEFAQSMDCTVYSKNGHSNLCNRTILDEMGHTHILLDEMGLDEMGRHHIFSSRTIISKVNLGQCY